MDIAEKLYTKGFISYPRTETNRFHPSINIRSLVQIHVGHTIWGQYAESLLAEGSDKF